MSGWPIHWGFGGIGWGGGIYGVPSLYVALRFGETDGRQPIGFIVRWLPRRLKASSGLRIGRLLFVSYRRPRRRSA